MSYYCVGFNWEDGSHLQDFIDDNFWENGYSDRFLETVKNVQPGSFLAAKTTYTRNSGSGKVSVLEVHAIGEVVGNPGNGNTLEVKWTPLVPTKKLDGKGAYRSTIARVRNEENIKAIFSSSPSAGVSQIIKAEPEDEIPLNVILYGPPGTGKTYATVEKAVEIIDPVFVEDLLKASAGTEYRSKIRERFQELVKNKQIAFITFHQSLSYEDFVEGIKPVYDNEIKQITYPVRDGIFKEICLDALRNQVLVNEKLKGNEDSEGDVNFDLLYDGFINGLRQQSDDFPFETKEGSRLRIGELQPNYLVVYYEWSNRKTKQSAGKTPFAIKKDVLEQMFKGGITNKERNLKERLTQFITYHTSPYYAVYKKLYEYITGITTKIDSLLKDEPAPDMSIQNLKHSSIESGFEYYLEKYHALLEVDKDTEPGDRFVLIIDEINRGNVSAILGELITLLEKDKRVGMSESLTLKLPYSRQQFGVPSNLYLIGTMNTADRSVEALDSALRRRFSFEFIGPQPSLLIDEHGQETRVGDVSLKRLLAVINERISYLLDVDHQIGHSYFYDIAAGDEKALREAFKNKIIPLLSEYFYNDYEKILWVLGSGFITVEEDAPIFAYKDADGLGKTIYDFRPIGDDFNIVDALKQTLGEES